MLYEFEELSKQYRLGTVGTGTLSHDLNRWWARLRGKEDPFARVGEVNDRATKGDSKYVWALKDINFEVKQGEVLGIIGKNGAGKSTLLKILSKVTAPTQGRIKVNGRIASLLEVGTGFHQELTGRENIFLNGAILGMTKAEIKSKLDEIVEFAGVARYLDTPVKRYSSGMTVRLAFAVAAHLEPEILVVDEVLAVGDAEFQQKAIGKMKEVSEGGGRTVLFVSHNMGSIRSLCRSGIVLNNGKLDFIGNVNDAVRRYLENSKAGRNTEKLEQKLSSTKKYELQITNISVCNPDLGENTFFSGSSLRVDIYYNANDDLLLSNYLVVGVHIKNNYGDVISKINTRISGFKMSKMYSKGILKLHVDHLNISAGSYYLGIDVAIENTRILYTLEEAYHLKILPSNYYNGGVMSNLATHGMICFTNKWEHYELSEGNCEEKTLVFGRN